jgi:uncharacterized protein (DUF736 family)
MQIFLFKNKFKEAVSDPDYIVRDTERNILGAGWDKEDKHGEVYQTIALNDEE